MMAEGVNENCYNHSVKLNELSKNSQIMSSLDNGEHPGSQYDAKNEPTNGHINGHEKQVLQNGSLPEEQNVDLVHLAEDDLKLFEHQVSGHGTEEKGLLKHKNGWVLKPLQPPPMGRREVSFYQEIHKNPQQESCYANLRQFVPSYHGVASLSRKSANTTQQQHLYLLLEDVIEGFKKPCVADIKIGAQTWSPDATEAKIKQEMSKYRGTKIPLGVCLTGMLYYNARTGEKCKMSKDFGKSLVPATLKTAMETFFNKENSVLHRTLATRTIKQLQEIEKVFSVQKTFKLFGSSVLLAYDAEFLSSTDNGEVGKQELDNVDIPLRVFMIDFAHFHPEVRDEKVDENYLFGLRNFIKILCDTVEEPTTEQ